MRSKSRYGILEKLMHPILLWQRPEPEELNRIQYVDKLVPSWSWMACTGPIEFAVPAERHLEWRTALSFEESSKNALSAAEIANFTGCELKGEETTEKILKERDRKTKEILKKEGGRIGWIRYDIVEDIPEFDLQKCIVVGRNKETYYVLIVIPLSLKDEYTRIGTGAIDCFYLLRIEGKVRVV